MSTLTPRLQLKRPDGSDPFLRADYIDALNKIDGSPGNHICTSTSRPNWGVAQAGRAIRETDTRTEWMWSGTAWLPILTATNAWNLSVGPNTYQGSGTTVTHSLGTIITTRPGTLLVDMSSIMNCIDTSAQSVSLLVFIDGVQAGPGVNSQGYAQWTGSNNNGATTDARTAVAKGYKAVDPGSHTISARTIVPSNGGISVGTFRVSANILLVNETSR